MRTAEMKVLSEDVNSWVVQVPGRKYPGVVIQGDSLRVLYGLALDVVEAAPDDQEVHSAAVQLAEILKGHLTIYEHALRAHGLSLPYSTPITAPPTGSGD